MTERRAYRPQGKHYDEIRISTVPYFRVGSAGQSEWRTHKQFQLLSKGRVLELDLDPDNNWLMVEVVERMMGKWNNRGGLPALTTATDQCDQEGCSETSTVTYKMKALYDSFGVATDPYVTDTRPLLRKFCDAHKKRGEGYYEDSDDNYVLVTDPL